MNVRIFRVRAMKCIRAQTRPQFIFSSERVLGWMEFEPMLTPREKSPLPENVPRGESNPQRCGQRAQALPTELFRPLARILIIVIPSEADQCSSLTARVIPFTAQQLLCTVARQELFFSVHSMVDRCAKEHWHNRVIWKESKFKKYLNSKVLLFYSILEIF